MNTHNLLTSENERSSFLLHLALAAALIFALIGCRATGGQPTMPPTNPPVQQPQPVPPTDTVPPATATIAQATTSPAPTNTAQPIATATTAANVNAQGDQVMQLLNQLDQMNQKGDAFNDLPQP